MPSENSHGEFLRFTGNVTQIRYFTPKMEGRYAFFVRVRSIFNLWQVSINSMVDFHSEHRISEHVSTSPCEDREFGARLRPVMRYHPVSRELR
jgi:hypothetical protein